MTYYFFFTLGKKRENKEEERKLKIYHHKNSCFCPKNIYGYVEKFLRVQSNFHIFVCFVSFYRKRIEIKVCEASKIPLWNILCPKKARVIFKQPLHDFK